MNQDVTDYINKLADKPKQEWQVAVCNTVRQAILQTIPDVAERLQYGKPHFLKNGKYVAVISASKAAVSVTIFNATDLQAPEGFFESSDVSDRQTIKIQDGTTVDYELFAKLLLEASQSL